MIERGFIRLVAELLRQDNLLLALDVLDLPLAILQSVVDAGLLLARILGTGSLLVLQFLIKLGDELDVACKKLNNQTSAFSPYGVEARKPCIEDPFDPDSSIHIPSAADCRNTLEVEKAA